MPTAMKLYEHVDALETVLDWVAEHEDEIRAAGGVLPPALEELLDEVEGDLETKVERTALVIRNQLANATAAQTEAERLTKIAGSYTRQAEMLKTYLKSQLDRSGKSKLETPLVKVWTQKNGRPSVKLADPTVIPAAFQRVRVEFDGQAAYEALKAANAIPEPEDGAVEIDGLVVERGTHLRIR